jgi:prepilin-type N-terminal cleavage/methylation domain-containing protein
MKTSKTNAFTLIELLVVISIIAILAGIALPVFSEVQVRGAQTKQLSNAKQIGTACKLFAMDYSGNYPQWTDMSTSPPQPTAGPSSLTDSNTVFATLMPDYIGDESIFWNPKAAKYCNKTPPDGKLSTTGGITLDKGECGWGYMAGLTDTSDARWPLIADATVSQQDTAYDTNEANAGGVWKGKKAILIHVDISGTIETLYSSAHTIKRPDDPKSDALKADPTTNWLPADASSFKWLVPKS